MREIGRGGALVAAAVAQLENKTHTRLTKKSSSQKTNSTPMNSKAKPQETQEKPTPSTAQTSRTQDKYYANDSSSSDNEDYQTKGVDKSDKDSVSVKSSERETSEADDLTTTEESEESDSEDRTQDSVLERIAEEGQSTIATNSVTSPDRGYDSDSPDDSSTVLCGTTDLSESSTPTTSGNSHKQREDTSTCCDDDFQWIKSEPNTSAYIDQNPAPDSEDECRKIIKSKRTDIQTPKIQDKPPMPNSSSLDRRRHHPPNRMDRDQKSRSSHNLKTQHYSPSRSYQGEDLYQNNPMDYCNNRIPDNGNYSPYTPPKHIGELQRRAMSYEHFNRRHEHNDPKRYGSNCMLTDPRMDGSTYHSDLRNVPYYLHGSHGDVCYNSHYPHRSGMECFCHPAPQYWCSCSEQNRYRMHYGCKNQDGDERVRRLESDKDSLQLQVSVLSEQIAAQTEKINDLERLLGEKRTLLASAEEVLQREILARSSLETQKLELMSTVSEARLRQAALERENLDLKSSQRNNNISGSSSIIANGAVRRASHSPSPSPSPAASMMQHNARDNPPRTPPATYRRLINDQGPHSFSSLPRGASLGSTPNTPRTTQPLDTAVVLRSVGFGKPSQPHCMVMARGRGHSVPNLAEKDTIIGTASSPILGKVSTGGNKGWGSLFKGGSGGALEDITDGDQTLDPFQRGGVRATAAPRLQSTPLIVRWNTIPIKEWDADITCEWLESLGLECYNGDAKKWLTNPAGNKGILATALPQQIEKELNIKNPLHKKKILLALLDMQESSTDPLLGNAGRLDSSWTLRWLEDAGLPQYREAWAAARVDGRVLHRLCHEDLHALKVTSQLHALSIRRGIQVLRENVFSPDTMIRRGATNDATAENENEAETGHVSRWSSHRVMEWLRAVDLAEYAPNLRGAGVHGGLMYYEVRFTGELLATLLNIPPSKTLLRRHLNTRFNQLLGKEIIQEKREAEQTLGYQPLTLTSKVKVVKKGQFTLKRKKNKNEPEYGDLVCPIVDQASGEILSTTKMETSGGELAVASRTSDEMSNSTDSPISQRSDNSRS